MEMVFVNPSAILRKEQDSVMLACPPTMRCAHAREAGAIPPSARRKPRKARIDGAPSLDPVLRPWPEWSASTHRQPTLTYTSDESDEMDEETWGLGACHDDGASPGWGTGSKTGNTLLAGTAGR